MKTVNILYHLTRADFFERVRRYSFLFVLALMVFAGYLFVPPEGADYIVLHIGLKRGIYNSQWIGLIFGTIAAMHLPLFGFFLVKNSVERDRQTGAGQIIATTPTGKIVYVIGKWLSNLMVLVLILCILTLMAAIMQLIRAEDTTLNIGGLVAPIWLMGLPVLAIAAALAVLFECTPLLRSGFGNVVYFIIWLSTLIIVVSGAFDETTELAQPINDHLAFTLSMADVQQEVLAEEPDAEMSSGLVMPLNGRKVSTFIWDGLDWTPRYILERAMWLGIAVVVALVAAIPFDRFDSAKSRLKTERKNWFSDKTNKIRIFKQGDFLQQKSAVPEITDTTTTITPLTKFPDKVNFWGVFLAEIKLMIKGQSIIWYVGLFGLIIACIFSPFDFIQQYLWLAVWVWPLLTWSQMGTRERRYNTSQILFSTPQPAFRQLIAMWLAGVIFTIFASSGIWFHLTSLEGSTTLLGWFVGALFVPALAVTLGVLFGNSRAFEMLYLLLWYLGLVNRVPVFDFTGLTTESLEMNMPVVYLVITAGLLLLAVIIRRQQIQ